MEGSKLGKKVNELYGKPRLISRRGKKSIGFNAVRPF